jgi:hypothetical protein
MKAFLEHFAAILGALTVALLTMSVVHEYGYFTFIGRHFQTLLTTTDYLANGVLWLPWALFLILIADWKLLDAKPDWSKRTTWLMASLMIGGLAVMIVVSRWPPDPALIFSSLGMLVIFWSWVWQFLYKPIGALGDELNALYEKIFKIGPPALTFVFLFGCIFANIDAHRTTDPYIVKFKGQDDAELRILLRSFDRGLLMRNAVSHQIEFRRWDDIVLLEKRQAATTESLLCYFTGYDCRVETPAIP